MKWFNVLAVAIIIEGLTEYIKTAFPKISGGLTYICTAVLGIVLCIVYQADIFAVAGLTGSVPLVGCICTGVLVSRGASYVHQIIKKITTVSGEDLDLPESLEIPEDETHGNNTEDEGVM